MAWVEHLDTVAKVGAGGLVAAVSAWLSGLLSRRRMVQRVKRAIDHEIEVLQRRIVEALLMLAADTGAIETGKFITVSIQRMPSAATSGANQVGAFDHLATPDAERVRALAADIAVINDSLGHRELYMATNQNFGNFGAVRKLLNHQLIARLGTLKVAAEAVRSGLGDLNTVAGGKKFLGRF